MENFKIRDLKLKNIWQMFLVIAIPFITVTGATIFTYTLRFPLIYHVGILFAVVFVLTDITLQFNAVSGTAFIMLSYL